MISSHAQYQAMRSRQQSVRDPFWFSRYRLKDARKFRVFLFSIVFVGTFEEEVEQPLAEELSFFAVMYSWAMVFAKGLEIQLVESELL